MTETTSPEMLDPTEENEQEPSFDNVLQKLGALGKFQITQISFVYLTVLIWTGVAFSFIFQGYVPPHVCNPVNETKLLSKYGLDNYTTAEVLYEACQIRVVVNQSGKLEEVDSMNCPNGRNFFDAKYTTFLSEWDLVCESRGVAEFSQTCFIIGQMIGAVVGSSLSNRFGRRISLIVSTLSMSVVELCVIAAPTIFAVYGFKILSGTLCQTLISCSFVFTLELVVPHHREANGVVLCLLWVVGALTTGSMAYFFRNYNWRYFQATIGMSGLFSLAYPFVLHESPRWLVANGRMEEALRIVEIASKRNGKDFGQVKAKFIEYANHSFPSKSKQLTSSLVVNGKKDPDVVFEGSTTKQEKKPNILDMVRNKYLRKISLITWYILITNNLTYMGLYMTSSSLAGNRFLNFTLMTLVEIPSSILIYFMMKNTKRSLVLKVFYGLTAVSLMTSSLLYTFAEQVDGSSAASTVLFMFGKFFINAASSAIYIVTPEMFPTNIRSIAYGSLTGMAGIGTMVSPFFRPLFEIVKWGPGTIIAAMCFVATFLTFLLPETKDTSLPDTLNDISEDGWKKRQKMKTINS